MRIVGTHLMLAGAISLAGSLACNGIHAQSWSERTAKTVEQRWPLGRYQAADPATRWNYQLGFLLQAMETVKDNSSKEYIRATVDQLVKPDGSIPDYDVQEKLTDDYLPGRQLLHLYRQTHNDAYLQAARFVRAQIDLQPRNASGGLWHKKASPDQMLLDDVYMLAPFLAEYATMFNEPKDFADITHQFVLLETHTRDQKSGLLYQEWNEPKTEPWVNKATGTSASFWGRGTGWYMLALVDTLPYYSSGRDRNTLIAILNRTAAGIASHQDKESGLWYQVLDKPGERGNYLESSAAGMFVYALAKGVRLGYLPPRYLAVAQTAWKGMLKHFVQTDADGLITITSTVQGIDLGSLPSHDGSFTYYTTAPVVSNDPKGVAAFLLAASEIERLKGEAGKR